MSKVVFYSNYLNHHQLPFCLEMQKLTNGNFNFVAQKAISEKRIALGYQVLCDQYDFVVKTWENEENKKKAYDLALEADYVLFGSSDKDYIEERLKQNKITFKYSERLFKFGKNRLGLLREFRRVYLNHAKYRNKPLYMLCASSYATNDFVKYGAYKNKTYKWGYFPETKEYNVNELIDGKQKDITSILWVGRLIDWKHPELAIKIAKKLKEENISFTMNIIGQGDMEDELSSMIDKYELNDYVCMLGSMQPTEVRKHMEQSNIFMFTSDYSEGWGAVLNEAMNSGCAVVSSHAIGSTGFLINNEENGLIYNNESFDDLYNKVKSLVLDRKYCNKLGINAYKTVSEKWNAKVAAERFIELNKCLQQGKDTPFTDGPCSKAFPIKEKDMYDYLVKKK